jgi:geranylgeranyl diphosphate synthase type II
MSFDLKRYLEQQREVVEKAMDRLVLNESVQQGVFSEHIKAMRYSLFVGGKRVRPILCLAAARCITQDKDIQKALLPAACALECIHTYSLIHDDLPAMDNDDLRRGKPTSHVVFGEAGAILAGDGLLTLAFDLLSDPAHTQPDVRQQLEIIQTIARAAGSLGMVGGQALDVANEGKKIPFELLRTIHRSKTGALLTAAVVAGAIGAGASPEQRAAMENYGKGIGLAFQIVDDLLDVEGSTEELGKPAGSDVENNKATYPLFFGVEESRRKAKQASAQAIENLSIFDEQAEPLRALAKYIVTRSN